jgi:uncharacterized phiE125 gp8 family phage protein
VRQDIWGIGSGASLALTAAPTTEPVTLAEAKADRRIDNVDSDTQLGSLIMAARSMAETYTGRQLMPATYEFRLDRFALPVLLPRPPLASVTSIVYVDTQGAAQTLDPGEYQIDATALPARLLPAFGKVWPWTRWQLNAVKITFVAGYADAGSVPVMIRRAILLLVGHWYENREPVVMGTATPLPMAVDSLLLPYRVPMILP